MTQPAVLVLEDGSTFKGTAIGAYHRGTLCTTIGEVVFNTALTGYQEILTDPSYTDQLITLTCPHIGNVGVNPEDNESKRIFAKGLIIRQLPVMGSNWRQKESLDAFLRAQNILGIEGIDTRRLTRLIRTKGALNGAIVTSENMDSIVIQNTLESVKSFPGLKNKDLAKVVTTSEPYNWQGGGLWKGPDERDREQTKECLFKVVAYDFGIKHSILRSLTELGCHVRVVPATTKAEDVIKLNPDGVFLSNGPGDPEPCDYAIKNIQILMKQHIPLFGICLGFQLLGLSLGAKTTKMKFGHHGGNHPVQNIQTKQVLITSQNHGFAVEESTLPEGLEVTHRSLFDNTLQGFRHRQLPVYGFQGHPEAGPGPNEGRQLFEPFIKAMMAKVESSADAKQGVEVY